MFKRLVIESAIATTGILMAMWLISLIPLNLSALQPLEKAVKDFDIMDIYYSQVNNTQTEVSQHVVLVNIADADRYGIAELINAIGEGQPEVIGVDVFFAAPRDAFQDSCLAYAVANNPVVLGAAFDEAKQRLTTSFNQLQPRKTGYTNFIGANRQTETIRYYKPMAKTEMGTAASFAWQLATFGQEGQERYKNNFDKQEIRFIGNYQSFRHYEFAEVLSGAVNPEVFKNKVVLVGYAGQYFGDENRVEDRFFTPKNPQVSGRSFPDMNGMVIHANIVEMLITGKRIHRIGRLLSVLFTVLVIYVHVLFYMFLMVKLDYYFDPLALILQIMSSLLMIFVLFYLYHHFQIRIHIIGALVGIAFAVEILFVYEALAHTLFKKFGIKSIVIDA